MVNLQAENKRLKQENERLWQQVRMLKARQARLSDLALSYPDSAKLAARTREALAELEFVASPVKAIPLNALVTGSSDVSPIPGADTSKERAFVNRWKRDLENLLHRAEQWLHQPHPAQLELPFEEEE